MNKIIKIIIFETCILVILVLLLLFSPQNKSKTSIVCFKENCFEVEIAKTPLQMEKGLMFRENLDKDKGMLFVFEKEDNYPFWMRNTLIPLDIIWINENYEVVFIEENAKPCPPSPPPSLKLRKDKKATDGQVAEVECPLIEPGQNAKYVLEINGGLAKEMNIKVGDNMATQ